MENTLYFLKLNNHWHNRKGWEKESNTVKGASLLNLRKPRESQMLLYCTSPGIRPYISHCFNFTVIYGGNWSLQSDGKREMTKYFLLQFVVFYPSIKKFISLILISGQWTPCMVHIVQEIAKTWGYLQHIT